MNRRTFIAMAAGLATPVAAGAQSARLAQIGFLAPTSEPVGRLLVEAFRRGLREAGYSEGENAHIEFRWSEGQDDRFPALVQDLVSRNVDVIVAVTLPAIRAAQRATSANPIVMVLSSDPVRMGLVASLARPDGNTTGVASLFQDICAGADAGGLARRLGDDCDPAWLSIGDLGWLCFPDPGGSVSGDR